MALGLSPTARVVAAPASPSPSPSVPACLPARRIQLRLLRGGCLVRGAHHPVPVRRPLPAHDVPAGRACERQPALPDLGRTPRPLTFMRKFLGISCTVVLMRSLHVTPGSPAHSLYLLCTFSPSLPLPLATPHPPPCPLSGEDSSGGDCVREVPPSVQQCKADQVGGRDRHTHAGWSAGQPARHLVSTSVG